MPKRKSDPTEGYISTSAPEADTQVEEVEDKDERISCIPRLTQPKSVRALNKAFARIMKERFRTYKHKAKACCRFRRDLPFFAHRKVVDERGETCLSLRLVHETVEMTNGCNLAECDPITCDMYLCLKGRLIDEMRKISHAELV